jgi:hypothetical protein
VICKVGQGLYKVLPKLIFSDQKASSQRPNLEAIARIGRQFNHTPEALAKEGDKQRQHSKARSSWTLLGHPTQLSIKRSDENAMGP